MIGSRRKVAATGWVAQNTTIEGGQEDPTSPVATIPLASVQKGEEGGVHAHLEPLLLMPVNSPSVAATKASWLFQFHLQPPTAKYTILPRTNMGGILFHATQNKL